MKKLFICLFIAVLLPLNVVSQTQTPPPSESKSASNGQFTLKTSTEVVLVNVTVRDKNENFIKDMKVQDFTILEDGKAQQPRFARGAIGLECAPVGGIGTIAKRVP